LKTSENKVKNQKRVYEAYLDKRAHMQEFVDKFRFNAKRASLVQSRIKAIEKLDEEAPEDVVVEQVWRFSVENPEQLGIPIIEVNDIYFDYDKEKEKEEVREGKGRWRAAEKLLMTLNSSLRSSPLRCSSAR